MKKFIGDIIGKAFENWIIAVIATGSLTAGLVCLVVRLWGWLSKSVVLPRWSLVLVSLFALIGLALVVVLIVAWIVSLRPQQHSYEWESYKQDTFLGLDWYWDYSGAKIVDIRVVCPVCKGSVRIHEYPTELKCVSCCRVTRSPVNEAYDLRQWLADQIGQQVRQRELGPPGMCFYA